MARYTEIDRCSGQNHIHFSIQRTSGANITRTILMSEAIGPAPETEAYLMERIQLHVREAQAAGNTTYAQIRAYLLALPEWVE